MEVFDSDKLGKDTSLGNSNPDITDILAMDGQEDEPMEEPPVEESAVEEAVAEGAPVDNAANEEPMQEEPAPTGAAAE